MLDTIGEAIGVQVRQILPKGDTTRSHVSHRNYGSSTIFQSHLCEWVARLYIKL